MIATTPKPVKSNPFRAGSDMARMFDGVRKSYKEGHRDIVRDNGTVRCMGNNMAVSFWKGYDGIPPYTIQQGSLAYACYRAGQTARIEDDARGVFVPPRTNSIASLAAAM